MLVKLRNYIRIFNSIGSAGTDTRLVFHTQQKKFIEWTVDQWVFPDISFTVISGFT